MDRLQVHSTAVDWSTIQQLIPVSVNISFSALTIRCHLALCVSVVERGASRSTFLPNLASAECPSGCKLGV